MTGDLARFTLPAVMKVDDCERLHAFLRDHGDDPVQLDCSAVIRLGGLAAQLITMGAQARANTDRTFTISAASTGFQHSMTSLGLGHLLTQGEPRA